MVKKETKGAILPKIKFLVFFLSLILLTNLGYGLDLTLENPENSTYTTSINIPLEFTSNDNNGTCHYVLNSGSQVHVPSCLDTRFNVNYDGNYTLDLFAFNDSDEVNATVTFSVDRTTEFEEGKPFLMSIIILVFLGFSFLFVSLSNSFKEEGIQMIKASCSFAALISMITTLSLSIVAVNEYLKFPSVLRMTSVYNRALMGILVFIIFIIFIMFMFKIITKFKEKSKFRKW